MPLKLILPRKGRSPNYTIRGTYLNRYVNRSARTGKRAIAVKALKRIEREIESGTFSERGEPTFASAAASYMKAGGERTYMTPLIQHFKTTPLRLIDQAAIDDAAVAIYPYASGATRNRQVYTPISAVLKRRGFKDAIDRPAGAQGQKLTGWLWPEQAVKLFDEADKLDPEFGLLCKTLLYAGGLRLSEGLSLLIDNVRLSENFAFLPVSKNEDPRALHLPPFLVVELANHPRGMSRPGERVFKFHKSGHIYSLLKTAAFKAGVDLPPRLAFHIFCHTYATWMRRYGKLDTKGLVGTRRWKDLKSADRYEHVIASEEAQRADLLPVGKIRGIA